MDSSSSDWSLEYDVDSISSIPDWKFDIMGYLTSVNLKEIPGKSERKPNPNESIELELEKINCDRCDKVTNQILLNENSNYPMDRTISKTQVFRCSCEKINERIIYGCETCEKCTIQILVQDIRNKEPETLEESEYFCKLFRCKTCGTFNEIFRDSDDNSDQGIGMKGLL